MPILHGSSYRAPFGLWNADAQTILPARLRPRHVLPFMCQRLELPDGDFIDIDHVCLGKKEENQERKAVILSHGLEGNTSRRYMLGMAQRFAREGWDIIARNFRGRSGEVNRLLPSYHSGETGDLDFVVRWAIAQGYTQLVLIGFSMGGNQTLKYLGELGQGIRPNSTERNKNILSTIKCAVTFSVPCDLVGSAKVIDQKRNSIYMAYFMNTLRETMRMKAERYPLQVDLTGIDSMRSFAEFDERYTAPMFGFSSALDYWTRASCKPYLSSISIPTLLVNALDDPFLSPTCYPFEEARSNPMFSLEIPHRGGHVGFIAINKANCFWSEDRAMEFVQSILGQKEA